MFLIEKKSRAACHAQPLGMASASMWAFLIFTPPLVLRAYRMRRPELSVQAAAFTSVLPTTNLDFPDVLTRPQTLRGWRVCCTVCARGPLHLAGPPRVGGAAPKP